MIEYLWALTLELWEFLRANFDPIRDTAEILIVAAGIYWLLLLIRGTRATQILMGLFLLVVLSLLADLLQLATLSSRSARWRSRWRRSCARRRCSRRSASAR